MTKIKLADLLATKFEQGPRQELLGVILQKIQRRKLTSIRLKAMFSLASLASISVYALVNWQALALDLSQSAFWQMPRLLMFNFNVVLANWQDYGWYMIESLPIFSIAVVTVLLWLALEATKFSSELFNINHKVKI